MKQIIIERNVDYATWENLIYAIVILSGLFIGTTFFSTGNLSNYLSIVFGILLIICIISIAIKKGLVQEKKLYRGYFLFDKVIRKKEIQKSASNNFTLLKKRYRQKHIRDRREPDWEYSVDSFELIFFDENNAVKNLIIKCLTYESCEKAKKFLIANSELKFKGLD